jgi:hypothetical protein
MRDHLQRVLGRHGLADTVVAAQGAEPSGASELEGVAYLNGARIDAQR